MISHSRAKSDSENPFIILSYSLRSNPKNEKKIPKKSDKIFDWLACAHKKVSHAKSLKHNKGETIHVNS